MTDNSGMHAERRRIERALHDGVQQDLIAVAVRLQVARRLAASDLLAALELLDEIGRDVHDALGRVRTLADDIYPSLLDAQGLVEALRGGASVMGVETQIEAHGVGRYAADVEATVYFSCRAALESVAAQAGRGARATIRLREDAGTLHFEVTGDGGTRVSASLPLSDAPPVGS